MTRVASGRRASAVPSRPIARQAPEPTCAASCRSRRSAGCGSRSACPASATGSACSPHRAGRRARRRQSSAGAELRRRAACFVLRLLPAVVLGPLAGVSPTGSTGAGPWSSATSCAVRAVRCRSRWSARCGGCSSRRSWSRRQPVLDPGQGGHGPEPGAAGPAGGGQPAQPRHHLRHRAGRARRCSPCSRCSPACSARRYAVLRRPTRSTSRCTSTR